MSYFKSGIVTRIEVISDIDGVLGEYFDLDLFFKTGNVYLLNSSFFNDNICSYREEYMSFCDGFCDSLSSCEAYVLETDVCLMLGSGICFSCGNRSYFFNGFSYVFDTDECCFRYKNLELKLFFIPVFWDINYVSCLDIGFISIVVNKLTRGTMKNVLKGASWFTVI